MLALKQIYGLNDAPLAWQLSSHSVLTDDLGAHRSKLGENSFASKTANKDKIDTLDNLGSMITTDDLAVMGDQKWLDQHYQKFVDRFQKVSRRKLPFDHCGCT